MDELFEFKKNALMGVVTDPLCEEYKRDWARVEKDKEKLVALSLRQQAIPYFAHHCHLRKGLSRKYILSNFDKFINGFTHKDCDGVKGYTYGLYVDMGDYDIDLSQDVAHVMWCVGTTIIVPATLCPHIYVSNRSKVHIVCDGYNSVKLSVFDKSEVTIEDCDKDTNITVFNYGQNKEVVKKGQFFFGQLKVFNKELRL